MRRFLVRPKDHPASTQAPARRSSAIQPVREGSGSFAVSLDDVGSQKIQVIAAVRGLRPRGLAEVKQLVESAPVIVVQNVDRADAERTVKALADVGARATIYEPDPGPR